MSFTIGFNLFTLCCIPTLLTMAGSLLLLKYLYATAPEMYWDEENA